MLLLEHLAHFGRGVDLYAGGGSADGASSKLNSPEGPAIGEILLSSVVVRVAETGDEQVLVVEKLKASGNETDLSDEEIESEGELALMNDVFCLLLETSF